MKKNIWLSIIILVVGFTAGWFANHCYKKTCSFKKVSQIESQATRRLAQQRHAIPAEFPEDLVQYHCVLKVRYLTDEVNRPGRSIWQWQPNLEASGYNIDDISTQLHEELAKRKGQIEEKMYCHKVVFEETK